MMSERICAIIVTLSPDIAHLRSLIDNLQNQVEQIVVVDNSAGDVTGSEFHGLPFVEVLLNAENLGVAVAHNQGIRWAEKHFFSHVLLLDQDSMTTSGMVDALLSVEKELCSRGVRVGAVGPVVLDAKSRVAEPLIRVKGLRGMAQSCRQSANFCEVAYLISSGCLIRLEHIAQIGPMDGGLFVDLVDVEWGLRSRQKGFALYVACAAQLYHTIGKKKSFVLGYALTGHVPLRLYYQSRNFFLLARRFRCQPPGWFCYHLIRRLLPRVIIFSLLVAPRFENIGMIAKGICDGLSGIDGKYKGCEK